ncbi:radical SAM/SPASM domain-containing protein [Chloroflexota bacterium]
MSSNKIIRVIKNPYLIRLFGLYLRFEIRQKKALNQYHKGYTVLPEMPIRVRVEPTNVCNLKCVMCPNGQPGDVKARGFMSMEVYKSIIDELRLFPKPIWLFLYLGGEPLLHKEIIDMIKMAKNAGLNCRFNTNATLLQGDIIDELLNSGLDCIEFSFDDVSPDEYEAMRVNASYDNTLTNLTRFLERKKELKLNMPLVTISSLRLREKADYQYEKSYWRFKKLVSDYEVEENLGMAHLWAGGFHSNKSYNYKRDMPESKPKCSMPWTDLTINWKGEVVGCCFDLGYDCMLGDIKQDTIEHIWNNEKMVDFRKKLYDGDFDKLKLCKYCSLVWDEI